MGADKVRGCYRLQFSEVAAPCAPFVRFIRRLLIVYSSCAPVNQNLQGAINNQTNALLAVGAGATAAVTAMPFFTIKTQLQVQTSATEGVVGHQHQHRGLVNAATTIMKTEGVLGFYKGFSAFLPRCMMLVIAQMTTYDFVKVRAPSIVDLSNQSDNPNPPCHPITPPSHHATTPPGQTGQK